MAKKNKLNIQKELKDQIPYATQKQATASEQVSESQRTGAATSRTRKEFDPEQFERIKGVVDKYSPADGFLSALKGVYDANNPLTPEELLKKKEQEQARLRGAQTLSNISETARVIGDIASGFAGGNIYERQKPTTFAPQIQKSDDKYNQALQQFQQNRVNAAMKDAQIKQQQFQDALNKSMQNVTEQQTQAQTQAQAQRVGGTRAYSAAQQEAVKSAQTKRLYEYNNLNKGLSLAYTSDNPAEKGKLRAFKFKTKDEMNNTARQVVNTMFNNKQIDRQTIYSLFQANPQLYKKLQDDDGLGFVVPDENATPEQQNEDNLRNADIFIQKAIHEGDKAKAQTLYELLLNEGNSEALRRTRVILGGEDIGTDAPIQGPAQTDKEDTKTDIPTSTTEIVEEDTTGSLAPPEAKKKKKSLFE